MGDGKEVYDTAETSSRAPRKAKSSLPSHSDERINNNTPINTPGRIEKQALPKVQASFKPMQKPTVYSNVKPLPDTGLEAPVGEELAELKQNLKVSFSRMKEDIHYNRQQVTDLISVNLALQEQLQKLQEQLKTMETAKSLAQPRRGLNHELMRGLSRNRKGIIKQRIIALAEEARYSIPELKDIVVDDKGYCSKASFYRYIEELKALDSLDFVDLHGKASVAVAKKQSGATNAPFIENERYI